MNINEYIKFDEIWDKEICIDALIDCSDDLVDVESKGVLLSLKTENNLQLDSDECDFSNNEIMFQLSEKGGQNESDTVGWSRCYTIIVDSDFMLINATYEQG